MEETQERQVEGVPAQVRQEEEQGTQMEETGVVPGRQVVVHWEFCRLKLERQEVQVVRAEQVRQGGWQEVHSLFVVFAKVPLGHLLALTQLLPIRYSYYGVRPGRQPVQVEVAPEHVLQGDTQATHTEATATNPSGQ